MLIEITANLTELERLARVAPEVVRRETTAVLHLIEARIEKRVVERTPRGVGGEAGLAGSIHGEVMPYGEGVMTRVGTPLAHGEIIERGRRPGQRRPPTEPLKLWAMRKLGMSEEKAERAAFVMARSIGIKGFEGKWMFKATKEELDSWIMSQLNSIPGRVVARLGGGA